MAIAGSQRRMGLHARRDEFLSRLFWWAGCACAIGLAGWTVLRVPSRAGSPQDAKGHAAGSRVDPTSQSLAWQEPHWSVNVNQADWVELSLLPGVSRVLSQRMVDERIRRGRFRSLDELDQVRGVGPALLEKWEGLIEW
jgi:DNA uptake protein ComE-like DNA-binding protein